MNFKELVFPIVAVRRGEDVGMNVHQMKADTVRDERYARVSLYSLEMGRRFACAPRYVGNEIVPCPVYIRVIPNYLGVAVEADASKGFQHMDVDCYLVAVENPDGMIGGRRFLMSGDELRSSYHPVR